MIRAEGTALRQDDGVIESSNPILERIAACDRLLLGHRYFKLCERGAISREAMIEIVKQLYCFSVFFERILTRRIAEFSSGLDERVIDMARDHLREEIGHAAMFQECLIENGFPASEIADLTPKMFTKAMFGYLLATVQHENEYVTNVAIMQVMESIGFHFFRSTLDVMKRHGMTSAAFEAHSEADEDHRFLGIDLVASFDARTLAASLRIVDDIYRLMGYVLDEWLDTAESGGLPHWSQPPPDLGAMRESHISSLLPQEARHHHDPSTSRHRK